METVRGEGRLIGNALFKAIFAMRRLSGSKTTADARRSAPTQSRLAACSANIGNNAKTALRACIRQPYWHLPAWPPVAENPQVADYLIARPLTVAAMLSNWFRSTMPLSLRQIV